MSSCTSFLGASKHHSLVVRADGQVVTHLGFRSCYIHSWFHLSHLFWSITRWTGHVKCGDLVLFAEILGTLHIFGSLIVKYNNDASLIARMFKAWRNVQLCPLGGIVTFILWLAWRVHLMFCLLQGSTCAFVESMLRASGFRTGLFTSPHLFDIRERFRFNGSVSQLDMQLFWNLSAGCT